MKMEARLKSGILWNIAGFGVTALLGMVTNIVVMLYGSSDILGMYNQLTAYYAVLGQLASCGMQQAGVYFLARAQDKDDEGRIAGSMLSCSAVAGAAAALFLYLAAGALGRYIYRDPAMAAGIRAVAAAAVPFGINKCILGILNAYRQMEKFSVLQMMKYVIILLTVLTAVYWQKFYEYGIYCFLAAEMLTLILGLFCLRKAVRVKRPRFSMIKEQFVFGSKAVVGGVVNQLNTKVDILVLGIFCSNDIVGIYSFGAMLAEGFLTILFVIRANINPILAQLLKAGQSEKLSHWISQLQKYSRLAAFAFQGLVMAGYYILCYLMQKPTYLKGAFPLLILLTGISIAVPQILKGNMMTLSGRPQADSKITVAVVFTNIVCNVLLVQRFHMTGVAAATAFSYGVYIVLVEGSLRRYGICADNKQN